MQVEDLEDVAEVDQQPRRHPRLVVERLGLEPGASLFADCLGVVDLGLLRVGHRDR